MVYHAIPFCKLKIFMGSANSTRHSASPRVLVVDDEADIRELLYITLTRMGLSVDTVATQRAARASLADDGPYHLCLTDMRMPDGSGLDLVKFVAKEHPEVPIAMITAYGKVETAVEALKAGAFDFVSKPVDVKALRSMVSSAIRIPTEPPDRSDRPAQKLLGKSEGMMRVRQTIARLARSQAPVIISGESGVGKELAARAIHESGPRSEHPFVPVNCGAIPTELMESELFGHSKGAFTGASATKTGLFEAASGGTIFLDEVAELPLHMQVKLLRVVQEKRVRPVGDVGERPVDVRILSATHRNLPEAVAAGEFRQDLFFRLNVIELRIPPLRERRDDIVELSGHILRKIADRWGAPTPRITDGALEKLARHTFPGNVRELENALERAMTFADADAILADHIDLTPAPRGDDSGEITLRGDTPLEEYMNALERAAILDALEKTRYNKTAAAKELGISFRALRYRLKKLDMD